MKQLKLQESNLQRPFFLRDGRRIYHPLLVRKGPLTKKPSKLTKFQGSFVPKDRTLTIWCRPITEPTHPLFGLNKHQIWQLVVALLGDDYTVASGVEFGVDLFTQLTPKCFTDQTDDEVAILNTKIRICLLFENEEAAVNAWADLHTVRGKFQWVVVPQRAESKKTYVDITFESMLYHWFGDLNEDCVSYLRGKCKLAVKLHMDGVGHHPVITFVSITLVSLDRLPIFGNKKPVPLPIPKVIAVGSESQHREIIRGVYAEVGQFAKVLFHFRQNSEATIQLTTDPVVSNSDRLNYAFDTGGASITGPSASIFDVELFYSVCTRLPSKFVIGLRKK